MQIERILDKASKLGISIDANLSNEENISLIAESLGVDSSNLNALENRLDNEIAVNNYGDISEYIPEESTGSFGEKEYNQAKDENGVYDKNYYSNKQEELDKKVSDAKEEKGNNWKKKDSTNDEPIQANESNTISKNKFDKAKDQMDLLKAKNDALKNKIDSAKAKAYGATHPEEALKNKARNVINNAKENVKTQIKEKGKQVIVEFVKKNPWVLAAIGILILVLFLLLLAVGSTSSSNLKRYSSNEQIDTYCNSKDNNNFSLRSTPLSKSEFVNKALDFFEANPNNYTNCQTVLNDKEALETIYDVSLEHNTSPEVTISRAIAEGCSPGTGIGLSTNHCEYDTEGKNRGVGDFTYDWNTSYNYWGIDTFNGTWTSPSGNVLHNSWACYAAIYDSLEEAVIAFSDIVSKFDTAAAMMETYSSGGNGAAKAAGMASIRNTIFYDGDSSKSFDCDEYYASQKVSDNASYWWPVGSSETTEVNGVLYATGTPAATAITARFGGNDTVHKGLGGGHGALDIGASQGSYVIASKSGTVIYPKESDKIDYQNSYIKPDANGKYNCSGLHGNYVEIDHGDGVITQYNHLLANTITVKAGDIVNQGQVIGKVGSSGCSTGPHLHFAIRINGTAVDPEEYVYPSDPRSN